MRELIGTVAAAGLPLLVIAIVILGIRWRAMLGRR